jgi:hypothetical protein
VPWKGEDNNSKVQGLALHLINMAHVQFAQCFGRSTESFDWLAVSTGFQLSQAVGSPAAMLNISRSSDSWLLNTSLGSEAYSEESYQW